MKWPFALEKKETLSLNALLSRLEESYQTTSGEAVTPESCMQSPTVHAIVTAVSRRIAASPVHVMRRTEAGNRERKERLPNHPVARLLRRPNMWQSRSSFWLDVVSAYMRYGRFTAYKSRPATGPVANLIPLLGDAVNIEQLENFELQFKHNAADGTWRTYSQDQVFYVRGPARDYVTGDSPIMLVRESIAMEIAAERFGSAFFGNGAMPSIIFKLMDGFKGFRTDEDQAAFLEQFKANYGGKKRFKGMLLPKGMDLSEIKVENEKAQFLETRRYQRTVIAGAFGVPPHLVGDLERATFNNVEQQDKDFVINVVMPVAKAFEDAMEMSLLTDEDRRNGVIIRFNLDAVQRADFKSRQEGLAIQRQWGVISPNDWRERENMNPLAEDDGGEEYIRPMNMVVPGEEPEPAPAPFEEDDGTEGA